MRWIIILFVALALSVLAIYKNQQRPAIRDVHATTTPETLVLYQDELLGFSVTVQQRDEMKTENLEGFLPVTETSVVGFQLPSTLFAGTNLGDAGVYIGASSSPTVLKSCIKKRENSGETLSGTTTVNGATWNVFTSIDAGAGNLYESKTYRTVHGGNCFEMVELLHSGNINNYPEGTVVEFDKPRFQKSLESISSTFTFTK